MSVRRYQGLGVGYFLKNIFPSGNFPRAFSLNVQFPNRKVPKSVLASACGPLACSSRSTRPPKPIQAEALGPQIILFSLKLQDPSWYTPYCICIQPYRPVRLARVERTQNVLCNKCSPAKSQCIAACGTSEGLKFPLVKLYILEVDICEIDTWEVALGKTLLGKYLSLPPLVFYTADLVWYSMVFLVYLVWYSLVFLVYLVWYSLVFLVYLVW